MLMRRIELLQVASLCWWGSVSDGVVKRVGVASCHPQFTKLPPFPVVNSRMCVWSGRWSVMVSDYVTRPTTSIACCGLGVQHTWPLSDLISVRWLRAGRLECCCVWTYLVSACVIFSCCFAATSHDLICYIANGFAGHWRPTIPN